MFSSAPHAAHAHNHCVRIYDVLDVPDEEGRELVLLVMPLLGDWREPGFGTVGEFVGFVGQVFEVGDIRCLTGLYILTVLRAYDL